jgi:photosystem II stability/assembly factor-like uncharacterized protein
MKPGRDDVTRDEALLRRWDGVTARAARPPSSDMLARSRRATNRRGQFAAAAAALLVLAVATAGVGAWISFRNGPIAGGSASPSSTPSAASAPPTATESPIASEAPTATPNPLALVLVALRQYEYVVEVHRIGAGGWVLTSERLMLSDGTSWRQCLDRPMPGPGTSGPWTPNTAAVVDVATIRVFAAVDMLLSTDACATWSDVSLPIAPTGVSFPTRQVGFMAAGVGSNRLSAGIYRTADGGAHWVAMPTVKSVTRMPLANLGLAFADADHGWLTDGQTLWSTSNGARSWNVTHLPVPASVRGSPDTIQTPVVGPAGEATVVAKYDRSPGMDGVSGQLVFYRTADKGAHWTSAAVVADPGMLMTAVVNSTTWVVADPETGSSVQATTDGGKTWPTTAVSQRWPFRASSMSFADPTHGWLIVNEPEPPCPQPSVGLRICDYAFSPPQHLVATDDGGATWHTVLP